MPGELAFSWRNHECKGTIIHDFVYAKSCTHAEIQMLRRIKSNRCALCCMQGFFITCFCTCQHSLQCPQCAKRFALEHIINLYAPGNLWDRHIQVHFVPSTVLLCTYWTSKLSMHTWN